MNHQQYEHYYEAKDHTPLDFPYNTYLCTIPLDFHFVPTHWHREMEIIVIHKGEGIVTLNLEAIEVNAGDIIFVLPGQLHSIHQKDQSSMEYENIFFKQELLRTGSDDICHKNFLEPLYSGRIDFPLHITTDYVHYPELISCISQLDLYSSKRPYGYQLALKSTLLQLFFLLVNHHPLKKRATKRTHSLEKLKIVLSYIEEHYNQTISIASVAKSCHYSESYFMKFFKNCMGISFCQYVNDYRLQIAAQLLKESEDTILSISTSCGFENLSYFNRMFKRKYGISPGKYRNI